MCPSPAQSQLTSLHYSLGAHPVPTEFQTPTHSYCGITAVTIGCNVCVCVCSPYKSVLLTPDRISNAST